MFSAFQAKNEEVEELNKELRQCNLQQFIQQTGVLPSQARSDLQEQLELTHLLQDSLQDGNVETTTVFSRNAAKSTLSQKISVFISQVRV